ncbi:MAG: RidA family protein [Candidatus Sumerlaeia bacterium]|nr:RidA family protein [Candidatus Sumerlaeia bacterium]
MSTLEAKLNALGLALPPVAKPVAAYIPATRFGNIVMTSGQLPTVEGHLPTTGRVGQDLLPEEAAGLARIACLNGLAAAAAVAGGLDKLRRVVRIVVYVQSADDFHGQPAVANGASEFLLALFGDAGRHARTAIGVNALPLNAPVEVELVVEVED